jgi:hypothetical protein
MNDKAIRVPTRSLKEQFSRSSEAWKEQSDPIFRFWAEGDWWGFPLFSLGTSRYFGDKETLCLYWPLGTLIITDHGSEGAGLLCWVLRPQSNLS